ncbi:hypothetical protein [Streptomyces sannanensis]|uniref:hypothetical protein n=1 Tax=Streptomyces sannanensis TaxID=285536 RepID=UPI0031F1AEE4
MSGSLWLEPGSTGRDTLPRIPRQGPGRAAADPVEELAERLEELIAAAVHPDEVAAILESDGMTDDHIRLTYGREDSFALAADLYAQVPRRFPEPPPGSAGGTPGRTSALLGCLLRGIVFALPGLAYVLAAPLLAPIAVGPLLAAALVGWVWNQTLSHRAHSWLGLGDRTAAGRALLVGAPAGALLGAAAGAAFTGPGQWPSAAFAAGQALYLGAATVLLVLGRERALFCALLPMAAGAAWTTVYDAPPTARTFLLSGSLLAVTCLAGAAIRHVLGAPLGAPPAVAGGGSRVRPRTDTPVEPAGGVTFMPVRRSRTDTPARRTWRGSAGRAQQPRLAASVPYGLFGLGSGVLVLHTALGDVFANGAGAAVSAPSAVALTLAMGPAEWLLHRFRSESLAGLRASTTPRAFWRATTATIAQCLAGFLAVLLLLALAGTLLRPDAPSLSGIRLATLLLIGMVLWTGLLLQSFGAVLSAAIVCGAAAAAQTLAALTGTGSPAVVGLTVAGAAAVVLAVLVCVLLGRATAHRV